MTPCGVYELGTSPSCLALNAAGTRLYSANETDRVGDDKEGTVSALAIHRDDGRLERLNTVRSGGAGPTYVSVHPSGRFLLEIHFMNFSEMMSGSGTPKHSETISVRNQERIELRINLEE